jgi:hypothetical protein
MKTEKLFLTYISKLKKQFKQAKTQKNPALWLYANNTRTFLFMVESLCKLFEKNPEDNNFKEWHDAFKKLEDGLGQIDFYDVFLKEFSKNKKIASKAIRYLESKKTKAVKKLNKRLIKGNWCGKRIEMFETFIKKKNAIIDPACIKRLEETIRGELIWLKQFAGSVKYNFSDIEFEVHEVRRKLRWISIYSQSLQGIVKLVEDKSKRGWQKKYFTKNIIASPFNKLPVAKDLPCYIEFKRNHFFAFSWMINELGILKDKGLKLELLAKAIRKTEGTNKTKALKTAQLQLGVKYTEQTVLSEASKITKEFFVKNKIADGLMNKPAVGKLKN